jgi:hypothetical protein
LVTPDTDDAWKDLLVPRRIRPYWTFKNTTFVVLFVSVLTAVVRACVRFSSEYVSRVESQNPLRSPVYLALYYVFVAFVLLLVYATRDRASWYVWRVAVFGMVLAGALIGIIDLMLPLRTL